ncbi:hypothetical protein Tsubulata_049808 [Turnera subulata]|uniref:Uncharacterized protein n=1 Tax=Turnera subulata TaxID=218843 RepID=A0A9Q0G5K1_9ROSI|nr:hypothetical protein Tsubulata_049808 [Turnera subulata]
MEHLAIESFSQSWLTSINSSLKDIEEPLRPSFDGSHEVMINTRRIKLKRSSFEAHNFNFDVPVSQSSDVIVHADQLFADGIIKPFFNHSNTNSLDIVPTNRPSFSLKAFLSAFKLHCHFLGRWKHALQNCLKFARPVCHSERGSRKSIKVNDLDRSVWEVGSRSSNSPHVSLRRRIAYSMADCCDVESSIYEAVLHCKRSMSTFPGLLLRSFQLIFIG